MQYYWKINSHFLPRAANTQKRLGRFKQRWKNKANISFSFLSQVSQEHLENKEHNSWKEVKPKLMSEGQKLSGLQLFMGRNQELDLVLPNKYTRNMSWIHQINQL